MDPTALLLRLRELAEAVLANRALHPSSEIEAAEQFEALDQWITRSGFLPAPWRPTQPVYNGQDAAPSA